MTDIDREKTELLHDVLLFAELDDQELQAIADVAQSKQFPAKSKVVREGESGDSCYIVGRGRLRAVQEQSKRLITLAQFQPGDIFGELALFDNEVRSATVEALSDVELLAIQRKDLRRLVREYPSLALKLLTALARKLRATSDRLAGRSFQSVDERVLTLLCELAGESEEVIVDGKDAYPMIVMTQQEIAQVVGSSRESVSRFLAGLDRSGYIIQRQGKILVPDLKRLRSYDEF